MPLLDSLFFDPRSVAALPIPNASGEERAVAIPTAPQDVRPMLAGKPGGADALMAMLRRAIANAPVAGELPAGYSGRGQAFLPPGAPAQSGEMPFADRWAAPPAGDATAEAALPQWAFGAASPVGLLNGAFAPPAAGFDGAGEGLTPPAPREAAPSAPASLAPPALTAVAEDATRPAAARDAVGTMAGAPDTSLLGRLGTAFGRLGTAINERPMTLMALGAGMAGAPSLGAGVSRGLAAAMPAMRADIEQGRVNQTAKAMISRGVPEDVAQMAAANPEVMRAMVPQLFGAKRKFTELGSDAEGGKIYGFVDEVRNQAFDLAGNPLSSAQLTALSGRRAPKTVEVERADGTKATMQWDAAGGGWKPLEGAPGGEGPANPYSLGNKATEAQSKDAIYSTRMHEAERIMRDPKVVTAGMNNITLQMLNSVAPTAANVIAGAAGATDWQRYAQAQRNFINAVLRRESGAVISESEFSNARQQYFPQPGDAPEVLAQKQANRIDAIKGIAAGAGPRYKPPYLFGSAGEILDGPGGPAPAPAATAGTPQQFKSPDEVRAAVAAKKLKSGDAFLDANGVIRTVP